jgi:hypothetical protein
MVLVDTLWASPTQVHNNSCGNQILGVKNIKYKTWKNNLGHQDGDQFSCHFLMVMIFCWGFDFGYGRDYHLGSSLFTMFNVKKQLEHQDFD